MKDCGLSSRKQFAYLHEIALREADETLYWLEILTEAEVVPPQKIAALSQECQELVAILIALVRSTKRRPPESK